MNDNATIIRDARLPGIELLELQNIPGYHEEHILLSNSGQNGLRFQVWEDEDGDDPGTEIAHFHIKSRETALLIAARLTEWAERISNPLPPQEMEPVLAEDGVMRGIIMYSDGDNFTPRR